MTARRTVSVALASFDGEAFIERQLASIAAQTLLPDEVVVSDGGSRDRTVELVRAFFAAHPELGGRLIADGTRLGVSANFERAIVATTGDLVALSDQDDQWSPERLARQSQAFDDPAVSLSHSDARLVDVDGLPLGVDLFGALRVEATDLTALAGADAFALLIRRNLVTGATAMFRRTLLDPALPFPADWVHDEWLAALAAATGRLAPLADPLIDYRQHGGNQIGVTAPTLSGRIRTMFLPRGDRYARLARRAAELVERLDAINASPAWRELAGRKLAFERRRAAYPRARLRRLVPVLRDRRAGSYRDLSSQRGLDVIRDLIQPA